MTGSVGATHFVGVSGIGYDSAEPGTPVNKRGVFSYDHPTQLAEITDGLPNTIAVLQVTPDFLAPWLAGGGSTVRGVPEKDSIRPFVCTEYQNKRGTYAIMANGDVRFVREDIPDALFQAMVTIAGNEPIKKEDMDKFAPLVPKPAPPPVVPSPAPGGNDNAKPPTGNDAALIQGTWKVVGGEENGKAVALPAGVEMASVFTATEYSLLFNGQAKEKGTFKLDASASPKALEFTITDGADKGKTQLGIYELNGDTLRLCIAKPGTPRPTSFKTTQGGNAELFTLQRVKR